MSDAASNRDVNASWCRPPQSGQNKPLKPIHRSSRAENRICAANYSLVVSLPGFFPTPRATRRTPSKPSKINGHGENMAFLGQLTGHLQSLKEKTVFLAEGAPGIGQQLQNLKDGAPRLIESAVNAKNGLLNKVKLDSLGKVLNIPTLGRNQSPIDIVPVITSFGEHLQNAEFRVEYHNSGDFKIVNTGSVVSIIREDLFSPAIGNDSELAISFLAEEQFHLDAVHWHWGTEPMNGSEHTIGGVGYAGELHLVHRNTRFSSMDVALKQPNGVLTIAVFLNESHDDNPAITPFIDLLKNVTYKGNEAKVHNFNFNALFPSAEKTKEFWIYDGSETSEPFRETVKWLVFRSALPISSHQLEKLREVRAGGYDEEHERPLVPIRPPQAPNSRTIICSFRAAAGAPDLGFNKA